MSARLNLPALCVADLTYACTWCPEHTRGEATTREAVLSDLLRQWMLQDLLSALGENADDPDGYLARCTAAMAQDKAMIERQLGRELSDGELRLLASLNWQEIEVGRVLDVLDEVRGTR